GDRVNCWAVQDLAVVGRPFHPGIFRLHLRKTLWVNVAADCYMRILCLPKIPDKVRTPVAIPDHTNTDHRLTSEFFTSPTVLAASPPPIAGAVQKNSDPKNA